MTLRLLSSDTVHMDEGTFMWVHLTHFAVETAQDDRSLLASLIANPGYAYDYASPFNAEAVITEPAVHGRWWRGRVHPELFELCTAADAGSLLHGWVEDQDRTDPNHRQSPEAHQRLQDVCTLLRSGDLYKLRNPGAEDEHDYGWVTGNTGFHEFVVIDRSSRSLHLVVASDD